MSPKKKPALADGLTVDGREFAAAWMNVIVAACEDPERPVLFRSISLEVYPTALRLTSTDSTLLLTTTVDGSVTRDEAPIESVTIIDADKRGRGLLAWIYKLAVAAEKAGMPAPTVSLKVSQPQSEDRPTLSPGLARRMFTISTDTESVDLDIIEADFPTWRSLFPTDPPAAIPKVMFAGPLLARLGKFKDIAGGIRLTFSSETGPALISAGVPEVGVELEGLIMPMREVAE